MSSGKTPSGTSSPEVKAAANVEGNNEDPTGVSLRKAWRTLISNVVVAANAAEKVIGDRSSAVDPAVSEKHKKVLDSALLQTLKARSDIVRTAIAAEARLRGNAKETEALECCLRSQPSMGRKRKRDLHV